MSTSTQRIDETILCRAILETNGEAIIAADGEGVILFWNRGAERILGYSSSDALGQSLDIIIPERLRERHWEGYRHVMSGGESRYGQGDVLAVPGVRKDGAQISLEFTIAPLRDDDGRVIALAAVMRDVTARFEEMRALRRKVAQSSRPSDGSG